MAFDPLVPIQVYQERFEYGELSTDEYSQILDAWALLGEDRSAGLVRDEGVFGRALAHFAVSDSFALLGVEPPEDDFSGAVRLSGAFSDDNQKAVADVAAKAADELVNRYWEEVDPSAALKAILSARSPEELVDLPECTDFCECWRCQPTAEECVREWNEMKREEWSSISNGQSTEPLKPRSDSEMPDWLKPYAK